jgi:hypothetical protein
VQPDSSLIGRQSLDSARIPRLPRSAMHERKFAAPEPTKEEGFEEVGLNDEQSKAPKRRSFFAKFADSGEQGVPATTPSPSTSRFHLTGRKRAQSGQGAELGDMSNKPEAAEVNEVK